MNEPAGKKVNYRDEILAAVREVVKRKGVNEFEAGEIVENLLGKHPNMNESTIRTHITSRCCVNAAQHHAVTYTDYERIGRGLYRLYESMEKKLYFVDVNTRNNYLLALHVEITQEQGRNRVTFFDTNRGRGFEGELLVQEEGGFIFLTDDNKVMTFRIATVEEFDLSWRRYVEGDVPMFRTDEDLHKWYYGKFFD